MLTLQLKNNLTKTEIPPIYLENTGPSKKVSLIFRFLIMTFNLCFITNCGLNGYVYVLKIVLDILDKLIHNFRNVSGCLTLNEMHIKLASLIICSINYNLTNTSSVHLPEVRKQYYIVILITCFKH